jgi:small subunit ribosomal protein S1
VSIDLMVRQGAALDEGLEQELQEALTDERSGQPVDLDALFAGEALDFRASKIVPGRVTGIVGDAVVVDVGYKSEGAIPIREWLGEGAPHPCIGDRVEVLLERIEDEAGTVVLSYRKVKGLRDWEAFLAQHREGDVVSGTVKRRCKGGLLVDAGVLAFLPAGQVDTRRPHDLDAYVGQSVECQVVEIDRQRRNVVVSRRRLLEERRERAKEQLLAALEPGQVRKGIVRNIVEFGAFVDLGGVDGLLYVTDLAWHRVKDPREVVHLDQEVEVLVLRVDRQRGRIALSLKHRAPSPWAAAPSKYPVGSRHTGEVVNVTSYGAFVRLEPGLEGLLHISELAEGDEPQPGDAVEVEVLRVDASARKIALSRRRLDGR